jgi:hypothetical protein
MSSDKPWTPELVAEVRRLTLAGWSTRRVARAIGKSKGAVIGKAHRAGIRLNDQAAMVRAAYEADPTLRETSRLTLTEMRSTASPSSKPRAKKPAAVEKEAAFKARKPGRIMFLCGVLGL